MENKKQEIIHFYLDKSKKRIIGRIRNGKIAIISYIILGLAVAF